MAFIQRIVRSHLPRNPLRAALDKDARSAKRRHRHEAPDNRNECKNPHDYSLCNAFACVNEFRLVGRIRVVAKLLRARDSAKVAVGIRELSRLTASYRTPPPKGATRAESGAARRYAAEFHRGS